MITKDQLDKYFAVRREADTLFVPLITEAWHVGGLLLGSNRGFYLSIGPQIGHAGISFRYQNDYTKKSFVVEAPLTILSDETIVDERKKFVEEMIKSLR